jgi:hypothetical protein
MVELAVPCHRVLHVTDVAELYQARLLPSLLSVGIPSLPGQRSLHSILAQLGKTDSHRLAGGVGSFPSRRINHPCTMFVEAP